MIGNNVYGCSNSEEPEKIYYYNHGDNPYNITKCGNVGTSTGWAAYSDSLYMWANDYNATYLAASSKIDVTNISKLHCVVNQTMKSRHSITSFALDTGRPSNDSQHGQYRVIDISTYLHSYNDNLVTYIGDADVGDFILDVSGLTGEYYLTFKYAHNGHMYIYEVYGVE